MKVVGLPVGPTALPNGQRFRRRELPFEAEQKPAMGEEEFHRVAQRLQVGMEGGRQHAEKSSGEEGRGEGGGGGRGRGGGRGKRASARGEELWIREKGRGRKKGEEEEEGEEEVEEEE